ncbi:MAG: porin family protein [[Clostridium] fimetarium]|nr:porin family protein [Alistipes timonensis]MCM1406612.1 porin family protein [[Clostridium] fimetarium]
MKKILALALLAATGVGAASAEEITIDTNKLYVGGAVGFWRDITEHSTQVAIKPEIGYKLNPKYYVGASLGWYHNYSGDNVSYNMFNIAPYVRYNFYRNNKVAVFVDGTVEVGLGRTGYDGGHSDLAATYGIGFRPGVSLALNNHFSLIAKVGFFGYKGANKAARNGGEHSGFGVGLNTNDIQFGFNYTF